MRWTELALISTVFAIMAEVQWVASAGGSVWVSITTRSAMLEPSGRMREGRVLSRRRPSYPSCMKRSCQRQTQVFDLPVMDIPVHMRQTRVRPVRWESPPDFKCQTRSTREAVMSFSYKVTLSDPNKVGGAADAVLVYDLQQALSVWSQYITGLGTLVVALNIENTNEGRESGGPTSSFFVGTNSGLNVFEPSS